MGLISKAKDFIKGEEAGGDDFGDEFEATTEENDELLDDEFEDDEWEEEPEPEIQEWDNAYQFADEAIQARGFSGMGEFIPKAMCYRINKSPMFRDRVKVANETMRMVNKTMSMADEMGSGGGTEYGELAEELQEANQLIDEVEKFGDKEEEMVYEITNAVSEMAGAIAGGGGGGSMDANVSTTTSQEEL